MPHRRSVLYHEFRTGRDVVTCRPDAAVVLRIPNPGGVAAKVTSLAVHVEIDRSTEGLSQCRRKLAGYAAVVEHQGFHRYWGELPGLAYRVFWVVPSAERIATLCDAFKASPVAACFRFTTLAECTPDRVLTQPVWRALTLQPMTLYRSPPPPP